VNAHVLLLFPPLEHAPDQIASRPFDTLNVILVPPAEDADPVLPTLTLIPAGLDVTRTPLRPVAVTLRVNVVDGGGTGVTMSEAVRARFALCAVIVTEVDAETGVVEAVKAVEVAPAATVTLPGTFAAALLLASDTIMPPAGAALVNLTVPVDDAPPTTLVGLSESEDNAAGEGADG
jgi:hypothetical protein